MNLAALLEARAPGGPVENLSRLSGGASMESWSFDRDGAGYVLRRAPSPEFMAGRAYDLEVEAAIVRAARAAGVSAPEIVGELEPEDGLGIGYIMRRIDAEANPATILAAPPAGLIEDCARELARIHAIPLDRLPPLPAPSAAELLAQLRASFELHGGDRPVMALALAWLAAHLPAPAAPVFLHGDFRMGNLMVGEDGLAAVLDWELCRIGDRHQDLAYGCIGSWRFGHVDKPAFGAASLSEYRGAYQDASGVAVEPGRFRFWLIYSTLWWGLACLEMAAIWREADPSLERAVIGRRASETELDLLLLLEEDAPEAERGTIVARGPGPFDKPRRGPSAGRRGEPEDEELIAAVSRWISETVKPRLAGRDRFEANVALNALGMVARQAPDIRDRALSDDLLAGRASLATPGLLARLKRDALAKLAADQPKYAGLAKARAMWEQA